MIFHASERKAIFILILLIISIFILPQHFRAGEADLFLLPKAVVVDSIKQEEDSIKSVENRSPLKKVLPTKKRALHETRKKYVPIELNGADSTTLVKVRGIGPYYAAKIIHYRKQLGGFHSVKQLKELKMKYFHIDSNSHLFSVNPSLIRVVELDTASFKTLVHHPYLEYEDVQLIFNAKRKYGKINCDTLKKYGVLTLFKLKKIKPYFK